MALLRSLPQNATLADLRRTYADLLEKPRPLGQKIEAVEGIVPVRLSLVARCAAIGLMQLRIADLPIFVLGCCELHSQKQAQLKVGAFEPQPSVYQN